MLLFSDEKSFIVTRMKEFHPASMQVYDLHSKRWSKPKRSEIEFVLCLIGIRCVDIIYTEVGRRTNYIQ